jgi:hypothetical protein
MGEALVRRAVQRMLNEGGHAFSDVKPISIDDLGDTFERVKEDLTTMGCTSIEFIGSTGKKTIMNDIDLAIECDNSRDELFAMASDLLGSDSVTKSGSNTISMRYPIYSHGTITSDYVQIDVMLGKTSYLKWSRFGTSTMPGHKDESPVKGVARNILLAVVNRFIAGKLFGGKQTELDRVRYNIDYDNGLYKVVQTRKGLTPTKPLKNWKTIDREFISDDPDVIAAIMFGKGTKASDLTKIEDTIKAIKRSPLLKDVANEILTTFASELRDSVSKTPHLLGDNPESTLDYVDKLVGVNESLQHLVEKALSPGELSKYGPKRFEIFLDMLTSGTKFLLEPDGKISLIPNNELIFALKSYDASKVQAALLNTEYEDEIGVKHVGIKLNQLKKSAEFGGKAKMEMTKAIINETTFDKAIDAAIKQHGVISVVLGGTVIPGVVGSRHSGSEHVDSHGTSKADVVLLIDDGSNYKISIKMKKADYYLSGDRLLAPIVGPIIESLRNAVAPAPRIEQQQDGGWLMLVGPSDNPQKRDFKFEVSDEIAKLAVFGQGANEVDLLVKGDLTVAPELEDQYVSWYDVKSYQSVDEMPPNEKPVGLLRFNKGRSITYNGEKYMDIRPAIATASRAGNAIDVSYLT